MEIPAVRIQLTDPWVYLPGQRGGARSDHWADTHGREDGDRSDSEGRPNLQPLQNPPQSRPNQTPARIVLRSHLEHRQSTDEPHLTRGAVTSNISIAPGLDSVSQPPVMLRGFLTLSVPETVHIKQIVMTLSGVSETSCQARNARDVDVTSRNEIFLNSSHNILLDSVVSPTPTRIELTKASSSPECFPVLASGSTSNLIYRRPGGLQQQQKRNTLQPMSRRHSHSSFMAKLPCHQTDFSSLNRFHRDRRPSGINLSTLASSLTPAKSHHTRTQSVGILVPSNQASEHLPAPRYCQHNALASASSSLVIHDQVFNDLVSRVVPLKSLPDRTGPARGSNHGIMDTVQEPHLNESIERERADDRTVPLLIETGETCWGPSLLNLNEPCSGVLLEEEIKDNKTSKLRTRSRTILRKSWSNLSDIFKLSFGKRRGITTNDPIISSNPPLLSSPIYGEPLGFGDAFSSDPSTPLDSLQPLSLRLNKNVRNNRRLRLSQSFNSMIISPKPSLPSVRKVLSNLERRPTPNTSKSCSTIAVTKNSNQSSPSENLSHDCTYGLPSIKFEPGEYHIPFVLPIPVNLPPSLVGRFGFVDYRLRADVVQLGVIASDESSLEVIDSTIGSDVYEQEIGNELSSSNGAITVERIWENQLHYTVAFNTRKCIIGGKINLELVLNPLCHMKVYRISVFLLQKASYYSDTTKKYLLQTDVTKFEILNLNRQGQVIIDQSNKSQGRKSTQTDDLPLLPIVSDEPNAFVDSPLFGYFSRGSSRPLNSSINKSLDDEDDSEDNNYLDDEAAKSFSESGPWNLKFDLKIPTCNSSKLIKNDKEILNNVEEDEDSQSILPSVTHQKSPIVLRHYVRFVMRVERGDDFSLDKKGRRKRYDIIIESPIRVVSCRCKPYELPSYSFKNPIDCGTSIPTLLDPRTDQSVGQSRQCHCNDEYENTRRRAKLISRLSRLKEKLVVEHEDVVKSLDREESDGLGVDCMGGAEVSSLGDDQDRSQPTSSSASHLQDPNSGISSASSSSFFPLSTQPFHNPSWDISLVESANDLNSKTNTETFVLPNDSTRVNQTLM